MGSIKVKILKNNPNTKYVLIVLVACIWGLIIYKVIKGLNDDDTALPVITSIEPVKADTAIGYFLTPEPYADPFKNKVERLNNDYMFNNTYQSEVTISSPANINPPPVNNNYNNYQLPPKPVEQPPVITYKGYIYNPHTRKKTAMITYNGKPMVVGIADKLDEKTKVLSIDEQQLVFSFSGKKLVVGLGA